MSKSIQQFMADRNLKSIGGFSLEQLQAAGIPIKYTPKPKPKREAK